MPNLQLPGTFTKTGNRYTDQEGTFSLYLHHRKEYTHRKPRLYLMYSIQGQPAKYLTGLYPKPDGAFIGEFQGVSWHISVTDENIVLERNLAYYTR